MSPPCTGKDDKLTGANYDHWKLLMRVWFISKGFWEIVQGTEKQPERPLLASTRRWTQDQEDAFVEELADWDDKDAKAHSAIVRCLSPEVSPAIQTLSGAYAVWSKLEALYARDSSMRAITLQGQLYGLTFPTNGSMQTFLMKAKIIHDQLLAMGAALTSSQLSALILTKLPPDYDMVARALRCQISKTNLDFDDLSSLLLEEEIVLVSQGKLKNLSITSGDQVHAAVNTKKKGRPRCFTCGKKGHLSRDCPQKKDKSKSKDQPSVKSKDTERDSDSDSDSLPSGSAKFPGSAGVAVATPSEGMY